jgi:hypothetical protein
MNTKTTNPLDKHLDAILRASGSALRHYGTSDKTIDDMRAALTAAVSELAPASSVPAGELSDEQIDGVYASTPMVFPGAEKFHRDFARAVIAADHALRQSKS